MVSKTLILIPFFIGALVLFSTLLMLNKKRKIRLLAVSVNTTTMFALLMVLFSPWLNCMGLMGGGSSTSDRYTKFVTLIDPQDLSYVRESDDDPGNTLGLTYFFYIENKKTVCVCVLPRTNDEKLISDKLLTKFVIFAASPSSAISGGSTTIPDNLIDLDDGVEALFPMLGSSMCPYGAGYYVGDLDFSDITHYKYIVGFNEFGKPMGSAQNPLYLKDQLKNAK